MHRDPSDPSFVQPQDVGIDTVVGGEKIACDRRLPRKNPARYSLLSDDVRAALPETAFELSLPATPDGFLDMDFVCAELGKSTKSLGTIVVSRPMLREMMRGLDDPVGRVVLMFGQLRNPKTFDAKSAFAKNSASVTENHPFASSPVVIATTGEGQGDQGEVAYQGVIVSNKCVNRAVGDPQRRSLGRNPVFEESMCAVLVTHVYDPPMKYAALGPHGTKKRGDTYDIVENPHQNAFDSVFLWNDFMNARRDQRGCGVSTFGFTDTKQSGKDVVRQLFPWPLVHAARTLGEFRRRDDLRRFLLETPMTLAGKRAAARKECPSGIDVRRFLLAELLLKNTPLEPLLTGQPPAFEFPSPLATV